MVHSCHLRRPPAVCGTFGRAGPCLHGPGTPTTGGLWFRGPIYASSARGSKSGRRRARTGGFVPFRVHPVRGCAAISAWTSPWNLSAVCWRRPTTVCKAGSHPQARVWPTGFDLLDQTLSGGLRSGELVLLGGPQGLGKTTWVLQVARNIARSGRCAMVFSFEHDLDTLLIRLVSLEAGQLGGIVAPNIARIRRASRRCDGPHRVAGRPAHGHQGGVEALEVVQEYSDRLLLHRSTGSSTSLEVITAAIDQVKEATGQSPLVVVDYLQKVPVAAARRGVRADHRRHRGPQGPRPRPRRPDPRGRRLRQGGPRLRQADARREHARLVGAGLRGRHRPAAEQQVRRGRPPPPRLRHGQRRAVPELGGAHRREEPQRSPAVDLEFQKRFDQSRFETSGRQVVEQLVDERVFVE